MIYENLVERGYDRDATACLGWKHRLTQTHLNVF